MGKKRAAPTLNKVDLKLGPLQKQLVKVLRAGLLAVLPDLLKFAKPTAVASGICRRSFLMDPALSEKALEADAVKFSGNQKALAAWLKEKAEPLCAAAPSSGYVADCERVGEVTHQAASPQTWLAIREYYWREHEEWINIHVRAKLANRLSQAPTEDQVQSVKDHVYDTVFQEEPFREIVLDYDPAKGREFTKFLQHHIIRWRAPDAIKKICSDEYDQRTEGKDDLDTMPHIPAPGPEINPGDFEELLLSCLEDLENEDKGSEKRTAFDLRYKAYLDPDHFGRATLRTVARKSATGVKRVRDDYAETQVQYRQLHCDVAECHAEYLETIKRMRRLGADLERAGACRVELGTLRWKAVYMRSIGDLEKAFARADEEGQTKQALEFEFMLGCKRLDNARTALKKVRAELEKFNEFRLPWVRSEPDIERLTGMDQVAVSRLLHEAKEFLRDCC